MRFSCSRRPIERGEAWPAARGMKLAPSLTSRAWLVNACTRPSAGTAAYGTVHPCVVLIYHTSYTKHIMTTACPRCPGRRSSRYYINATTLAASTRWPPSIYIKYGIYYSNNSFLSSTNHQCIGARDLPHARRHFKTDTKVLSSRGRPIAFVTYLYTTIQSFYLLFVHGHSSR